MPRKITEVFRKFSSIFFTAKKVNENFLFQRNALFFRVSELKQYYEKLNEKDKALVNGKPETSMIDHEKPPPPEPEPQKSSSTEENESAPAPTDTPLVNGLKINYIQIFSM